MKKNIYATISGIGSAVPEQIMTNNDWAKLVDTSDEWIVSRTGIKERRVTDALTSSSDLGYAAALKAIANAGIDKDQIEMIIVATTTPDNPLFPSTAAILQERLKCQAYGYDISAACSGFGYALTTAAQYIENGFCKNILLVAVDTLTKFVDKTDRSTAVLFGDGAGAMIISASNQPGHLASSMGLKGAGAEYLIVKAGGSRQPLTQSEVGTNRQYITMDGKEVFKFAVTIMNTGIREVLAKASLQIDDIDLFIPHQANTRIIDAAQKKLELPDEKIYVNIHRYGNTSSASIPIAIDEAYQEGKLKKDMLIATCGFGAGLTWAANVFRWTK